MITTMITIMLTVIALPRTVVYMLSRMFGDVLSWMIIYSFGAIAFSSGLFVLYRNARAPLGLEFLQLGDRECTQIDSALNSVSEVLLFLTEITLDGGGVWSCFRQSSADVPGLIVFGAFMVVVVLMLLNT